MPRFLITTSLVLVLFGSFSSPVLAQTSAPVAGDKVCGSTVDTVCKPKDLKVMASRLLVIFAAVGTGVLALVIAVRVILAIIAKMRGDQAALSRVREQSFNALIGFIVIFAVFGGVFVLMLSWLGTQPWVTKLMEMFASAFVETASAQERYLPDPLGNKTLYDIIMNGVRLGMRFFVYPALIAIWVAAGFRFVISRGNPAGLTTARHWLVLALIATVIAFTLQGFIMAFKATAEKAFKPTSTLDAGHFRA